MQLKMTLALAVTMVLFHILDRQIEFTSRTDFLWKAKLKVEQEEVETMRGINKILLENILPAHVAEHFLASTRVTQVSEFPILKSHLPILKSCDKTELTNAQTHYKNLKER